jgi:hypothetical protein
MAVRKPKPTKRRERPVPALEPMDLSGVPVLIPTQEQIDEQMLKIDEFIKAWEAEFGPIKQQDYDDVERAWPESR